MDKVIHFEIPVDDMKRAEGFYKKVFGWNVEFVPEMNSRHRSAWQNSFMSQMSHNCLISINYFPVPAPVRADTFYQPFVFQQHKRFARALQ